MSEQWYAKMAYLPTHPRFCRARGPTAPGNALIDALARVLLKGRPEKEFALLGVKLTVIGTDRETVDGVHQYLLRAGAGVRKTAFLEDAQTAAVGADAVILFADHYPRQQALRTIVELSVGTIIVVTAEVGYFSASRTSESVAPRVVVLRRPVWGWMLLDAVRLGTGRAAGES